MPDEIEQEQLQAVRDLLDNEPEVRRAPRFSEEDKQQLALAAKAAGLKVIGWTDCYLGGGYHSEQHMEPGLVVRMPGGYSDLWNPRDFDGDALRLAASLGLQYEIDREPGSGTLTRPSRPIRVRVWAGGWHKVDVGTDIDPDLITAIRSAIVRAAAEIGANMQS